MMFLLLACSQTPEYVSTDAYNDVGDSYIEFELQVVQKPVGFNLTSDCGDQDFDDGLTLVNLPVTTDIQIIALDEFQQERLRLVITSDECGTATPFSDVVYDDFGSPLTGEYGVYALVLDQSSFYEFTGVYLEEGFDTLPITTWWEWSEDIGDFVAIRDPTRGDVRIGNAMIP